MSFINRVDTKFNVITRTEMGARNLSYCVKSISELYTFHYVGPHGDNYGVVGICAHKLLLNVDMIDDMVLAKYCVCSKREFESIFTELMYNQY